MKQSSLDIAMNITLDAIYNYNLDSINNIDNINGFTPLEKIEILNNVRLFFINYDKNIGGVEKEKIKTIDCSKVKGSER